MSLLVAALGLSMAANAEVPTQWQLGDAMPPLAVPLQETEAAAPSKVGDRSRASLMEANVRARYLFIPDSILDIWYFNSDDPGANPFDRPKIRAFVAGAEFVLRPEPTMWTFYVEWMGSTVEAGYWDDVEDPAQHDDGDWIVFDNFAMFAVGANYGHDVPVTNDTKDVWLSFVFGGGLGIGFVTGEMTEWNAGSNEDNTEPDCLPEAASYERKDSCAADGAIRVPGVAPILDLTFSAKVHFANRANIRIDAGLHDLVYIGGAAGGVF